VVLHVIFVMVDFIAIATLKTSVSLQFKSEKSSCPAVVLTCALAVFHYFYFFTCNRNVIKLGEL
jgi:hypothetical protein